MNSNRAIVEITYMQGCGTGYLAEWLVINLSLEPQGNNWPLARRGKEAPTQREKVQGDLPWEYETDQSLFSIYQHVSGTGLGYHQPTSVSL